MSSPTPRVPWIGADTSAKHWPGSGLRCKETNVPAVVENCVHCGRVYFEQDGVSPAGGYRFWCSQDCLDCGRRGDNCLHRFGPAHSFREEMPVNRGPAILTQVAP